MRKHLAIVAAIISVVLALAFPSDAQAMPKKFRNCPKVTQSNVTYLLYREGKNNHAIVTATKGKSVTLPKTIRAKGHTWKVDTIWDGGLSKNRQLKKVDVKASLKVVEDDTLFDRDARKVQITVHTLSDYRWLTQKGNTSIVTLKK